MVDHMFETVDEILRQNLPTFQQSGVPLYLQLAAYMRRNIETGVWPVGMRMPSLDALADSFDLARLTVRQAVQLLVGEGLLSSKQGKGTFVTAVPRSRMRKKMQISWEQLLHDFEDTVVEIISEADVDYCPGINEATQRCLSSYHFMKRLHSRGGAPYCLIDVYLAQDIFLRAPELLLSKPVLTVFGELKVEVGKARQVLTVGAADTEAAFFLKIAPGDPVAFVRRVAEDPQGNTIYMGDVIYRGDYVYQEIDLLV